MHSLAALDQISEKINEEQLSDENDYEDELDDYEMVPKEFDKIEYLKSVNEKRAREVQRVLPKYVAIFEGYDEKKQSKQNCDEEITPCLLDPQSAPMSNIP
jgi:hypothetical protein